MMTPSPPSSVVLFNSPPFFLLFSEEDSTPSEVYSRYTDDKLKDLATRLKERTQELKEKAIDPYATSPEITPPVSKYEHVQTNTRRGNRHTDVVRGLSPYSPFLCRSLPVQHLS